MGRALDRQWTWAGERIARAVSAHQHIIATPCQIVVLLPTANAERELIRSRIQARGDRRILGEGRAVHNERIA